MRENLIVGKASDGVCIAFNSIVFPWVTITGAESIGVGIGLSGSGGVR